MSQQAIAQKQKKVEALKEDIAKSSLVLVADYQGFSVKEITDLRKKLRKEKSEFKVVKNTLIERAVSESEYAELKDHLKGATALLLSYADPISPLKVLVKFINDGEKGKIRVGAIDKKVFNEKDLAEISKLPPREVLLGKVVGGLQSPIYGLVNVLSGPLRKLVYALSAIKDKKEGK